MQAIENLTEENTKKMSNPQRPANMTAASPAPAPVDPTETPAFKRWFGNSKVVDRDGYPQPVYHGSTHEFDEFKMDNSNDENHYGKGFYFTDSQHDVSKNYGDPKGPDLTSRIERRAEQIIDQQYDGIPSYNTPEYEAIYSDAKEKARQEIAGTTGGVVYVTYLKILRPVIVSAHGSGTSFEIHYSERSQNEYGSGVRLWQALLKAAGKFGVDGQAIWGRAMTHIETTEFTAYEFEKAIREDVYLLDDLSSPGQLISAVYQAMGFDGIIQKNAEDEFKNMGMHGGTNHYVVWNPRQIKSAIGNKGTFNPRSPKITAARKDFVTLYHGTSIDNVKSILKHGLQPPASGIAAPTDFYHAAPTRVFLTREYDLALDYAEKRAKRPSEKDRQSLRDTGFDSHGRFWNPEIAIVHIKLPRDVAAKLRCDRTESRGVYLRGSIPPKYIDKITVGKLSQHYPYSEKEPKAHYPKTATEEEHNPLLDYPTALDLQDWEEQGLYGSPAVDLIDSRVAYPVGKLTVTEDGRAAHGQTVCPTCNSEATIRACSDVGGIWLSCPKCGLIDV
jgi:hypothetical protein